MWCLHVLKSVIGCVFFYGVLCVVLCVCEETAATVGDYTHEWAVQINGGDTEAQAVASEQNYELVDKVFDNVYVFRHKRLAKRSVRPSVHHHRALHKHPKVSWAQQQKVLRRSKRDYQSKQDLSSGDMFSAMGQYRSDAHPPTAVLNDPQWPQMWYLNRGMGLDMRVQEAWAEGVTGRGVVATILDDGLEKGHPDIIRNYDPEASYDVNNRDHDPAPRYDLIDTNRHGTRCAGEVAADANNTVCAVGVAYEASIGGVRMLDGDVTDAVEARSLALNPQHIDIYSASWGPDDDGKTVDGPGELATRAFIEGINNGRKGLGSIFIWASGNGGRAHDNCNCDGYTNAIWTLSISSATERGNVPWYSEACSSTLATTYSSGSTGERKIITTDLHHECTTSHTGTSASAPLAAGIVALALQVNRNMTWRDMQHIVVRTARPENLDTTDWQTNGVGRRVSHRFGYGLMDAHAMVQLARNWTTVAPQRSCEVQAPHDDKLIPQKSYVTLKLEVSDCPGVQHLEHVQAMVSLSADRRGDLEIYLISPAGTKSTLLAQRPHDDSRAGFHSWPFMTVHMWGEKPLGYWVLEIHNNGHFYTNDKVEMRDFTLVLHGTEVAPGEPSPNSNYHNSFMPTISTAGNHISHQDLTHSTTGEREDGGSKDTNTQRHNPYDDAGHHSGRAGESNGHDTSAGFHGEANMGTDNAHSAASRPTPGVSLNTVMAQNPSVKKAGVDDHGHHTTVEVNGIDTRNPPQPVKITAPAAVLLPTGCLYVDPNTSACIECISGLLLHHGSCVTTCPNGHYLARVPAPPRASANSTMLRARRHLAIRSVKETSHVPFSGTMETKAEEVEPHLLPACNRCHFSCRQCLDSREDQCTACWPELILNDRSNGAGVCNSVVLTEALSRNPIQCCSTSAVILITVGCGVVFSTLCIVLVMRCCCSMDPDNGSGATGTDKSNGSTLISGSVDKLREIKNGFYYSNMPKKLTKTEASYRKLSDDTEKLVSSSRPFYDYSSSEEEIV